MDSTLREHLRIHLVVALAVMPRWVKSQYADKRGNFSDPAKRVMVDAILDTLDQQSDVREKTDRERYKGWDNPFPGSSC